MPSRNKFYVTLIVIAMLVSTGPFALGQTTVSQTNSRPLRQPPIHLPLSPAEQEVRKLEREWLDAYEQHDGVAMDRILADDFKLTQFGGGVQTKADILAQLKATRDPSRPEPNLSTEEVQSRVEGNSVILTGRFIQRMGRDDETRTMEARYTDTYVKRQGRWQVVASQLTPSIATPGIAIEKPNFSGVWVLDKSKSDGLPPSVDQTVTIVRDGNRVEVATKTTSERGEQNSKSSYVLDGKEKEVELSGPMPGSTVKGRQTSKWSSDGKGFESADEGTIETPNGPAVIKTSRKFQLSPDGGTLIIDISREGPMTTKSKRVFARATGATAGPAAVHKMSEAEIIKETETYLNQAVAEDAFSGAVLIAKNGKPIFEKAYGLANKSTNTPNNVDTKFNLGSINKSFTSVAIAQLAQQGKLSFNDPISKYLPDYPNKTVAAKVTIHQLLTHTSGMGMYFNEEFMKRRASLKTLADNLPLFVNDALAFEPGTKMQYSNAGYVVLGLIIEKLTKQDYFEYVREHIFKPAGMNNTDSYELEQGIPNLATGYTNMGLTGRPESGPRQDSTTHLSGKGNSAGGGYSTLDDMLKFGQAVIGHKLLNQQYTDIVLSNQSPPGQPSAGYGFFSTEVNGTRAIGNNGGGPGINSTFTVYPELGYTVVVMSNYDPPSANKVTSKIREMITAK
jgi:CubicO group peptidase (beta-lactamase class C family)/ketosteroid isomerase-like protein